MYVNIHHKHMLSVRVFRVWARTHNRGVCGCVVKLVCGVLGEEGGPDGCLGQGYKGSLPSQHKPESSVLGFTRA